MSFTATTQHLSIACTNPVGLVLVVVCVARGMP